MERDATGAYIKRYRGSYPFRILLPISEQMKNDIESVLYQDESKLSAVREAVQMLIDQRRGLFDGQS